MNNTVSQLNSPGWSFFVRASFALAVGSMALGLFFMPADLWVKGYLAMGSLYLTASSFILAKTVRDEFEGKKLANKISDAKAEKMLKEYLPE